jgi:hypothetical protein
MALAPYFDRAALAASQVVDRFDPETFKEQLLSASVGVAFSAEAAVAPEGKHLLDLLVRLLARLYPRLDLYCPDREYATPLRELATAINPQIDVTGLGQADLGIAIGNVSTRTRETLFVGASGWDALISRTSAQSIGRSENPLGAGAAACFAAANLFRRVFPVVGGDLDDEVRFSTFSFSREPTPRAVPNSGWRLDDEAVLAGVGAIGTAAAWALQRAPLAMTLHLVDGESVELSNLQRYVLAQVSDVGRPKVSVPVDGGAGRTQFLRHQMTWREFVSEFGFRWSWALAAFDNAQARRALQASLPRWVANAWTQPGDLGVSVHPQFASRGACVACLYLPTGQTLNEDQLVARALGIPDRWAEVRSLLHLGTPVPAALLTDIARGLHLPEGALRPFEEQPIRDLYVRGLCGGALLQLIRPDGAAREIHVPLAHQSALAGVLLAARLAREATGEGAQETRIGRVDVQRPLVREIDRPALRSFDGRCLCDDPDYVMTYRAKYGALSPHVSDVGTPQVRMTGEAGALR